MQIIENSLEKEAFSWSKKGKVLSAIELALLMGVLAFLISFLFYKFAPEDNPQRISSSNTMTIIVTVIGVLWGITFGGLVGLNFFSHKFFPVNEDCVRKYKEFRKKELEEKLLARMQDIQNATKETEESIQGYQQSIENIKKEITKYS